MVGNVEFLQVSDLMAAFFENGLNICHIEPLVSTKHHHMIEQVCNLVFELVIVVVLGSDDHFGTFLAAFLAYLVYALVKKIAGVGTLLGVFLSVGNYLVKISEYAHFIISFHMAH